MVKEIYDTLLEDIKNEDIFEAVKDLCRIEGVLFLAAEMGLIDDDEFEKRYEKAKIEVMKRGEIENDSIQSF